MSNDVKSSVDMNGGGKVVRDPITGEDITVVTELANVGLKFIRGSLIPTLEKSNDEKQLKYAQFLSSIGDVSIQKFDMICHYLLDTAKNSDTENQK